MERLLGSFGVPADEETLYRWLLDHPGQPPPLPDDPALAALADRGLAVLVSGRWSATPPDIAMASLSRACEAELHQAQRSAAALLRDYHPALPHTEDRLELLAGPALLEARVRGILGGARWEVAFFDKAPHVVTTSDVRQELTVLRRGVTIRAVYEQPSLTARYPVLDRLMAAGEQVRVMACVPFKLMLVDHRWALVPVDRGDETHRAVLIRSSPMLDALQAVFEAYWRRAAALRENPPDVDHALLELLAAGVPDQAIARRLGLGLRTVQRRVSALMRDLGAQTRFQAGMNAARRGLL